MQVKNFRNLAELDLPLTAGAVIVGENRSGKSNLIYAMRLLLDPALPNTDRHLKREDFWDGLSTGPDWDPMAELEEISVSVEIADFADEPAVVAALAEALVESEPMRARLTYRWAPRPAAEGAPEGSEGYEWRIFGGEDEESVVSPDLRGYLYFSFLGALRDVASDIGNWRRSPLRALLEQAAETASTEELESAAKAVADANEMIGQLKPVKTLGSNITKRMTTIGGEHQGLDTRLGVASLDPLRLLRGLRIFVDGEARRSLESASLGTLNVLYLALLELRLEQRLQGSEIAHVVTAIEEPEAHLHPHLQRSIFRRLLRGNESARTTIVTTQSPHIASVAKPSSLIVLRTDGTQTISAAARSAKLKPREWADLRRYLDATRAEMVFAKRVLLVEGFAEQVLVPSFARALNWNLDKEGVTICAIHGTHFESYALFLQALGIPWAVITDGDPDDEGTRRGVQRAERIRTRVSERGSPLSSERVFVGEVTLEHDVLSVSEENFEICQRALKSLSGAAPTKTTIDNWERPVSNAELQKVIRRVGGKGRFAQRLSAESLSPPPYAQKALDTLVQ